MKVILPEHGKLSTVGPVAFAVTTLAACILPEFVIFAASPALACPTIASTVRLQASPKIKIEWGVGIENNEKRVWVWKRRGNYRP